MDGKVNYPAPGCIVEFLEHNSVQIAMVLEESSGKLRLLLPSRRETKLAVNRLLPWYGPLLPVGMGREDAVRAMESARELRRVYKAEVDPLAVWEISQGEIEKANIDFLAGLFENNPDINKLAAYGHALLDFKTHFRFEPPNFQIYPAESVNKRLAEKLAKEEREALVEGGANFLKRLWENAQKRTVYNGESSEAGKLDSVVETRIYKILHARMLDPDSTEDQNLWQIISKGLPEDPFLPVQLLMAWGKVPPHYNFWLDRAGYEPGDDWWKAFEKQVDAIEAAAEIEIAALQRNESKFISIDGDKTRDIDDAFHIESRPDGGWSVDVALACPALGWSFGSEFDLEVRQRGTSIYLPEAFYHMLPERLGTGSFSLFEGKERPLFIIHLEITQDGEIIKCEPALGKGCLAANLVYSDVEAVLADAAKPDNRALEFNDQLKLAYAMASAREKKRISDGAIVMVRPEPEISLHGAGEDVKVDIDLPENVEKAHKTVSELMIAASGALADWAFEKNIALLHRTQNVAVPRENTGVWTRPEDLARIMHALVPSELEVDPAPHAALALRRYAPSTSPLRRYADLLNEAQILAWLKNGKPRFSREELENILSFLSVSLDRAGQVQRFRPRYWKLLYFRQQGDQRWWQGVITEENDNYVTVALPEKGLFARGRRQFFDEKACPGVDVSIRLGRINPLRNDIHILEVAPV